MSSPETDHSKEVFVSLRNVTLHYGKVPALDDISLDISPGMLTGMIGPDGVGKSSILSLITGSRAVQSGTVTVLGGNIQDKAHRDRICPRIAYMPQGLGKNLYFTLTVEENLQFFGSLFGHNAAERRKRIDLLTKSTGLYQFLDRQAGKLSGGMKQKLGLCCSLIHDPDLLVLDEPTTGLHLADIKQLMDVLLKLRDKGSTVLVIEHNLDVIKMADWIIDLGPEGGSNGGKIIARGTPEDVAENKKSYTGKYLREMLK